MSMKNINDVIDKLGELQDELEDMIDELYEVNGIAYGLTYELRRDTATSNNPQLKNLIGGFSKMRDMEREIGGKFYEFRNSARLLRDALEDEKQEEQAK